MVNYDLHNRWEQGLAERETSSKTKSNSITEKGLTASGFPDSARIDRKAHLMSPGSGTHIILFCS